MNTQTIIPQNFKSRTYKYNSFNFSANIDMINDKNKTIRKRERKNFKTLSKIQKSTKLSHWSDLLHTDHNKNKIQLLINIQSNGHK